MKFKKTSISASGYMFLGFALVVLSSLTPSAQSAETVSSTNRPGLLILAHGSPSASWGNAVMELVKKTKDLNEDQKNFFAINGAFMEFAKPDAASGIAALEAAGCDRIVVVPVFVCPTSHTHFDVPAVLGLYSSPSIRKTLKEEKAVIATPRVPVVVTQTLSEGDLLDRFVRDEIASLSLDPQNEAVLLISHGDEDHAGLVDPIMRRLVTEACGSRGITSGDWAFCEVGQSYSRNVVPRIKEFGEQKKRVLVVGLYLASSAKTIHEMGMKLGSRNRETASDPFEGIEVRFSEKGIIEHPDTPQWVLECAKAALP